MGEPLRDHVPGSVVTYYLAPSLEHLRDQVDACWPNRDRASDGWVGDTSHAARKSDHNPDYSAGGVVRALDIDRDGVDVGRILTATTGDSRVHYVIWDERIWVRGRGWRAYTGSNPHESHIHVSIRHGRTYENARTPWALEDDDMTPDQAKQLDAVYNALFYGSSVKGREYPGLLPTEAETQRRVTDTAREVWHTPVTRGGRPVAAIQELADCKTLLIRQEATIRALTDALAGGDVDLDAIRAAAEQGVADALASIDTVVTINTNKEKS